MIETTLKDIKPGEYFTFKPVEEPSEKLVYVRDGYNRSTKKFGYHKWSDIGHENEKKGTTKVYTGFTF